MKWIINIRAFIAIHGFQPIIFHDSVIFYANKPNYALGESIKTRHIIKTMNQARKVVTL